MTFSENRFPLFATAKLRFGVMRFGVMRGCWPNLSCGSPRRAVPMVVVGELEVDRITRRETGIARGMDNGHSG